MRYRVAMRGVLVAVVLWLACPSVARACSCLGAEPDSDEAFQALVDEATVVFEGRAVESQWEGDSTVQPFAVVRSFKGPPHEVITLDGGMRRERHKDSSSYSFSSSSCDSVFEPERTYLVFAYAGDDGALYSSVCSPTRLSREAGRYFKFLEKNRSEPGPPAIGPSSGCRAPGQAPSDRAVFVLFMVLGVRRRRSSRHRSSRR